LRARNLTLRSNAAAVEAWMSAGRTVIVGRWHAMLGAGLALTAAAVTVTAPPTLHAQAGGTLPFAIGERLEYSVSVGIAGTVGRGTMTVEGPVELRGTTTYLLRSDFRARVAWIDGFERCDSWLDPERMAILRSETSQKRPFAQHEEQVTVFPAESRWSTDAGRSGESPTDAPLDELAFIYFIRTMPLAPDSAYRVDRHYDPARNPVEVRVLGRETVRTGAGEFATIAVEMRVKDPRRFEREGVIRLNLTDDQWRIPVRIQGAMPVFGTATFTLESHQR
jgi:hypothetical protein